MGSWSSGTPSCASRGVAKGEHSVVGFRGGAGASLLHPKWRHFDSADRFWRTGGLCRVPLGGLGVGRCPRFGGGLHHMLQLRLLVRPSCIGSTSSCDSWARGLLARRRAVWRRNPCCTRCSHTARGRNRLGCQSACTLLGLRINALLGSALRAPVPLNARTAAWRGSAPRVPSPLFGRAAARLGSLVHALLGACARRLVGSLYLLSLVFWLCDGFPRIRRAAERLGDA
eukprot:scaffold282106_cov31-Tisochrysis_lutea.AAC.2